MQPTMPAHDAEAGRAFVVCGEALIDLFADDTADPGLLTLQARPGGSPFNTAIGLARLRQPVVFCGAVSRDWLGQRLLGALRAEGVDVAAVQRNDAPTTLSLVGLDAQRVPAYAFYGQGGADRQLTTDALRLLPPAPLAIHLGSYAGVVEPIASTARRLVEREHGRTPIAYDPNVRLNVQPDPARWREALDWMLPRTDLLKVSDEDLQLLLPGTAAENFAAAALQRGVGLVVVTRGACGCTGWTAAARVDVPAAAVDLVDTVGAGDSFQAALLTWLAERQQLSAPALAALSAGAVQAALAFATRAAALTCARRGADLPRRGELP